MAADGRAADRRSKRARDRVERVGGAYLGWESSEASSTFEGLLPRYGAAVKWIPRSDPFATNAVAMLTGAAMLLALSAATGEARVLPAQPVTWIAVGYLVVFGSVAMFALYLFALQRWTASAVSYTTLLLPLVTLSAGAAVAGERVSPLLLIGGAIILAGVYVGAFLRIRPARSSASSLPECLPVDAEAGARSATSARA
ncbi:MAG: DMT family transporter [Chloroflexi bacterium]|nr:DMT family transporter [Chloroflexota bacterium]